jgi:hypothetical protein
MVETLLSKSTASVPKKGGTRAIANLMHEKIGGLLMKCKSIALESLTFPPITKKPLCLRRKSHCARICIIARLTSENSIVVSVRPCSKFSAWVPEKARPQGIRKAGAREGSRGYLQILDQNDESVARGVLA